MIRVDAVWIATEPMDMRVGTDAALARVVKCLGRRIQITLIYLPIVAPIE